MGQLTENVVARNIYFVSVNTRGLGDAVTSSGTGSLYAGNQASAIGANQGLKYEYFWGMYDYCGGSGVSGNRDCSDKYIGYRWEPAAALVADAQTSFASQLNQTIGSSTFTDDHYLGLLSRVANVIILVGTILSGLAFLTGFLAHRFCFAFAALEALGAAGCLGTGCAIWTAIIYKARDAIPSGVGIDVHYGNALWMCWGAFAAIVISIVPLLITCCLGRSKY